MIPAEEALALLKEGNRRFVSEISNRDTIASRARRLELAAKPGAVRAILGCSDSRVPVEIVFDQGLATCFVTGSPETSLPLPYRQREFAAEQFGTRLVVVLGQQQCGAIQTTLQQLQRPHRKSVRATLHSIVDL